jgi:hypothetical protein
MVPSRKQLWRSVNRETRRDPGWLGYWLNRHRRTENLSPLELAERLRVTLESLLMLSLCRTPREELFRADLAAVCQLTGADEVILARLLRQEQGLERWHVTAEGAPGTISTGWLLAASDVPEEPPTEESPDDGRTN